jgi:hypothetical protein
MPPRPVVPHSISAGSSSPSARPTSLQPALSKAIRRQPHAALGNLFVMLDLRETAPWEPDRQATHG